MSVSIELLFDDHATSRCVDLWRRLEAGVECRPLSRGIGQPHISLALIDEGVEVDLETIVDTVGYETRAFDLGFSVVSSFQSAEGVIFIAPEPSEPLQQCHKLVHDHLAHVMVPSSPLYAIGRWVPHCTVAIDVPADVENDAVSIAGGSLPIAARCSTIRAFDYGQGQSRAVRLLRAA